MRGVSASHTPGPREVVGGVYNGHIVRRARKAWTCDAAQGWPEIRRCRKPIPAGAFYIEGDVDPDYAGGFGHERYCADCVDDHARAAIAKAHGENPNG